MGTVFPEPTRRSPSEMVSSFGGTLTLVVSLLTVALFTAALVPALKSWLPMTLAGTKRVPMPQITGSWPFGHEFKAEWLMVSMEALALGALGAVFAVFIMWLAKRSARKLEW